MNDNQTEQANWDYWETQTEVFLEEAVLLAFNIEPTNYLHASFGPQGFNSRPKGDSKHLELYNSALLWIARKDGDKKSKTKRVQPFHDSYYVNLPEFCLWVTQTKKLELPSRFPKRTKPESLIGLKNYPILSSFLEDIVNFYLESYASEVHSKHETGSLSAQLEKYLKDKSIQLPLSDCAAIIRTLNKIQKVESEKRN